MYYYAYINSEYVVTGVYNMPTELNLPGYISITADQYTNGNLVGKVYDPETNTFNTLPEWIGSSDEVKYKQSNTTLSTKLDEMDEEIASAQSGADGASAYDIAVENGFSGTEAQWLDSLHGSDGASGSDGSDGLSAYELAVQQGYSGTLSEWLESLEGAPGATGATGETGATGSNGTDGVDGEDGEDGATFTPSVDSNGVLSWTNDKSLPNPQTVNIKGPAGSDGADGATGASGADGADGTTVVVGSTTTGNPGTNASATGTLNSTTNTLTIDFVIPRGATGASGSSASITASEVLEKIKTVDGSGSGIDADKLDGLDSTAFATANHTHSGYATTTALDDLSTTVDGKANSVHTHSGYASTTDVESLQTAVNGKASSSHTHSEYSPTSHNHDTDYASATHSHSDYALSSHSHSDYASSTHNHDSAYSGINHVHSNYASNDDIDTLETAISGKADSSHSHSNYATATDLSDLADTVAGKANSNHTHNIYATTEQLNGKANASHTHVQSDITGLSTALSGKANSEHSHSTYITSSDLSTALESKAAANHTHSNYAATTHAHAINDVTGLQPALNGKASSSHSHAVADVSGLSSTLSGKANSTHSHAMSAVTGLSDALSGKANATHSHSNLAPITHSHSDYEPIASYPVGSVYISVDGTNPHDLFGGTWSAFGSGRVIMGVSSGGQAESTGGSNTVSLENHTHTTAGCALTAAQMPIHKHDLLNYNINGYTNDTFTNQSVEGLEKKGFTGNVATSHSGGGQAHYHGNTGSSGAATINVRQPYITVYMWKRTA